MQHLDDGFLHALADGEVPSDELGPVREHLEGCATCRARLDEARMEAEAARELIEILEVPALVPDGRTEGRKDGTKRKDGRAARLRWIPGLALAASLVLAAGVGYFGRGAAPFAPAEPAQAVPSDTVFLPASPLADAVSRQNETPAPAPPAFRPARPLGGARRAAETVAEPLVEADRDKKQRQDEGVAASNALAPADKPARKEEEAKLDQAVRERSSNDARDQASGASLARKAAAPPPAAQAAAPAASLEGRLMAKTAADAAVVVVTFPRAVELLGGRIKLIEGMVPARLEASGRMVRVIYVLDEGDLVLSQVSGTDSLSWNLAGPLAADSLARLRLRVR